ncbi:hypothetical protein DF3PA_20212 [Candidatus Defluviicoccus seviourii]|uniref:Uncharacterized protein n=2 Tax=root TaxID=1 RepID=A0A564WCX0_9PROT|nr:hypothetical protein DF3PB_1400007 [uncultured Defluviicoccus sp.]VUX46312.1 hypothetical protein DF3PA_20212 [Candidatus Defluviicoccus seviourii]
MHQGGDILDRYRRPEARAPECDEPKRRLTREQAAAQSAPCLCHSCSKSARSRQPGSSS